MKTKKILVYAGIIFFIFSASEIQAEKRVVQKKSRKSAYHNKTPLSKVKFNQNTRHINSFRVLPHTSITLKHRGVRFHYNEGKYYRHYGGNYINVSPPIGIRISVLPKGYMTFVIDNRAYYYINGIYYTQRNSGRVYEVVDAPIGAIVHYLPISAEQIQIDNKSFFESNLTIYSKINSSQGDAYKVVGRLESYGNHY